MVFDLQHASVYTVVSDNKASINTDVYSPLLRLLHIHPNLHCASGSYGFVRCVPIHVNSSDNQCRLKSINISLYIWSASVS